ncbi:LysR family transcriptional regulator [Salinisphaera hydrothermalis]|uniref:LysR family transcriptional regulator n=1 Tax=Salinisphaera hydrothermalis TaxID=563188 RepID=UPI00333E4C0C
MDRFTGLAVFTAAVEQGSLAAAARTLGITPAMASKHLAAIETSLGVRLMHRTTRRLHLTDVGQDYYQRSRHILESLDDADRAARELQDQPRGTLRVTAPTTFGAMHMGSPVAEYIRRYPDVDVEMTLDDRFVDLVSGGFDVAIRIGDLPDSSLVARPLARTEMIACAAPSYLAEHGRPAAPSDLCDHDRLAFSEAISAGDWGFTDTDAQMHNVFGRSRFSANNMEMLLAAALRGAGIAYGPRFVFHRHLATGDLEQILGNYTTRSLGIHAVYPSARLVGAKVRRFIELLEEWFGSSAEWRG